MHPVPESPEELTRFLNELAEGKASDTTRLMPVVYDRLKHIAEACFRSEQAGNTLQATALVNEAFVKLFDHRRVDWKGRAHFYNVAARAMRNLLVDQARARKRHDAAKQAKHGSPATLDQAIADASGITLDLVDLDEALDELATLDARQSRVVELKYLGGLEVEQVARVLGVSRATVERDWVSARAWLARRLHKETE